MNELIHFFSWICENANNNCYKCFIFLAKYKETRVLHNIVAVDYGAAVSQILLLFRFAVFNREKILCVCVFRLLHSDRDPIPDVPAIYFVMPTEENIDRICQVIAHSNSLSCTQLFAWVRLSTLGITEEFLSEVAGPKPWAKRC